MWRSGRGGHKKRKLERDLNRLYAETSTSDTSSDESFKPQHEYSHLYLLIIKNLFKIT
jgi:hypothetical protein